MRKKKRATIRLTNDIAVSLLCFLHRAIEFAMGTNSPRINATFYRIQSKRFIFPGYLYCVFFLKEINCFWKIQIQISQKKYSFLKKFNRKFRFQINAVTKRTKFAWESVTNYKKLNLKKTPEKLSHHDSRHTAVCVCVNKQDISQKRKAICIVYTLHIHTLYMHMKQYVW